MPKKSHIQNDTASVISALGGFRGVSEALSRRGKTITAQGIYKWQYDNRIAPALVLHVAIIALERNIDISYHPQIEDIHQCACYVSDLIDQAGNQQGHARRDAQAQGRDAPIL